MVSYTLPASLAHWPFWEPVPWLLRPPRPARKGGPRMLRSRGPAPLLIPTCNQVGYLVGGWRLARAGPGGERPGETAHVGGFPPGTALELSLAHPGDFPRLRLGRIIPHVPSCPSGGGVARRHSLPKVRPAAYHIDHGRCADGTAPHIPVSPGGWLLLPPAGCCHCCLQGAHSMDSRALPLVSAVLTAPG